MAEHLTIDGDMVDEIAFRKYGATSGATEAIYAANPELADRGPILPSGITILLPELTATQQKARTVKLWE